MKIQPKNTVFRILSTHIILICLLTNTMAQSEIIKNIELDSFSNRIAFDMGNSIIELAQKRNHSIAVEISRLNHTIFLYIDDRLPADKHNWLRRKANLARMFEESSLFVKKELEKRNLTIDKTFGFDEKDYAVKGGAIPVFVKGCGMIATISVSGLHDEEDHQIIIDALSSKYLKNQR
jgi:uncharacterized protein (UPF0303 family)